MSDLFMFSHSSIALCMISTNLLQVDRPYRQMSDWSAKLQKNYNLASPLRRLNYRYSLYDLKGPIMGLYNMHQKRPMQCRDHTVNPLQVQEVLRPEEGRIRCGGQHRQGRG